MTIAVSDIPAPTRPATASQGRVLLIAYSFPPVGGAGVQRPVKWVKYLHQLGWDVTVLTPANPSVPVTDTSLLAEIPAETTLLRARTYEPGYAVKQRIGGNADRRAGWLTAPRRWMGNAVRSLAGAALQPDPQILWYPQGVAVASRYLREVPHDVILCTAPPYSSFLMGCTLKRRFGLPLVVDYRDEWDLSSRYLENARRDAWSAFVQTRQQRYVLRHADAVVATTQASLRSVMERVPDRVRKPQALCVYNGFDEADFPETIPEQASRARDGRFRLLYTGTLWNLTDISPLVEAVEQLSRSQPQLAARLDIHCVGRKTPAQQALLSRLGVTPCRVISQDYCDHAQVLSMLHEADGLCLLLSDVPGAERVVPAKLFEYLAAQRDLLAICPAGEAATIAEKFFPEGCFSPSDPAGIAAWLARRIAHPATGDALPTRFELREYSRFRQTEQLSQLLSEVSRCSSRSREGTR